MQGLHWTDRIISTAVAETAVLKGHLYIYILWVEFTTHLFSEGVEESVVEGGSELLHYLDSINLRVPFCYVHDKLH